MKFYKFISIILHPIVLPIVGVLLYFVTIPHRVPKEHQLTILGVVFVATYLIPLIILIFLKSFGFIKSFQVESINERKTPVIFMIVLFYLLGNLFAKNNLVVDLSFLFYGTSLGLSIIYFLFIFKIKTSLHLLSFGSAIGFFLTLSIYYTISLLTIISVFIVFSGLVASARLHLKAHTSKEIYLGFFLGIASQFTVFYLL